MTGKGKTYNLLIPEKVQIRIVRIEDLLKERIKYFHHDNLILILSIITTHIQEDDKGNSYAQLKMKYLRNRVWNASEYISALKDIGVIQTFGKYITKEFAAKHNIDFNSYRYQFTDEYKSPGTKTELTNPKLIRTLAEAKAKEGRKTSRKYPAQKKILQKLTIDDRTAEEKVKRTYVKKNEVDKLNSALAAITRIQNEDWSFTVDDKVARLHTNLTNLPKVLRSTIRINGQKLKGYDIGNSVPFMANKILNNPESAGKFYPEPAKYPIMMLKSLRLSEQQDVRQYALITSKAEFYKYLATEFNKRGFSYDFETEKGKERLKKKVFQILFSSNQYSCKEKKIFHELFPGVNKAFSVLRMQKRDYLNYTLSRLESFAVLDLILENLNTNFPELYATQIYDSVISVVEDDGTALRIMREKLTEFIGVPPTLKAVDNFNEIEAEKFSTAPNFLSKTQSFNSNSLKEEEERRGTEGGGSPYDGEIFVKC